MMSCMTSAAWSHLVLSLCCTEHGTYRGAILSGRITSITMSRSGQLGRRYTVEMHCSDMHVCRHYERALETHEPSCVTRACVTSHVSKPYDYVNHMFMRL
jgi:hypothetical protein